MRECAQITILKAKCYISDAETIYVSAASIWEISIKIQLNKLQLDLATFIQEIEKIGVQSLAITWQHAQLTKALPLYHNRILLFVCSLHKQ